VEKNEETSPKEKRRRGSHPRKTAVVFVRKKKHPNTEKLFQVCQVDSNQGVPEILGKKRGGGSSAERKLVKDRTRKGGMLSLCT